jgi:hypothetical protein
VRRGRDHEEISWIPGHLDSDLAGHLWVRVKELCKCS